MHETAAHRYGTQLAEINRSDGNRSGYIPWRGLGECLGPSMFSSRALAYMYYSELKLSRPLMTLGCNVALYCTSNRSLFIREISTRRVETIRDT